jgi:hypothetical protein
MDRISQAFSTECSVAFFSSFEEEEGMLNVAVPNRTSWLNVAHVRWKIEKQTFFFALVNLNGVHLCAYPAWILVVLLGRFTIL